MSQITAADVKKLRDLTGAGMMDSKKALTEAEGDFDKAIEILRVKGLKGVAKREGRQTTAGLVAAKASGGYATLIELASETDFVAKNEKFIALADSVLEAVAASGAKDAAEGNAAAIGGEYLSAASFLGVAGLIYDQGVDALWYPIGYTVGYLFLLVLVAVGGGMVSQRFGGSAVPYGALVVAPALMVGAIILFMGAVSGAHLNPAVSIAFALRGDFPWRRVPAYIAAQLLGAVLATLVL